MSKPYEELTFADNFMFCKILSNDLDLCKELLELILGFKIAKVELSQTQKEIDIKYDSKAVRLDVYVEDAQNTVYDIEMQKVDTHELPKRSRYYQAMIDLNLIEKGDYYAKLKKSYVIFICLDNPFDKDLPILTFENTCNQDTDIKLNDETFKVFVNAKSTAPAIPERVRNLFDYLIKKEVHDELTKRIDESVTEAIEHQKWRVEYMTYAVNYLDAIEEGRYKGLEEGRAKGLEEGRAKGLEEGRAKGLEEGRVKGLEEGRVKGLEEGRAEGQIQTLYSLVKDEILTLSDAAKRAGMTEKEFLHATNTFDSQ